MKNYPKITSQSALTIKADMNNAIKYIINTMIHNPLNMSSYKINK